MLFIFLIVGMVEEQAGGERLQGEQENGDDGRLRRNVWRICSSFLAKKL